MVISLGLAQLFNQRFPGRRVARWALIAPWAASVMMTALDLQLDARQPDNGVVNVFLHELGLVQRSTPTRRTGWARPDSALVWMMGVAVFVSLPFTTYALLAGLQTIPARCTRRPGSTAPSSWHAYRRSRCRCCARRSWSPLVINLMNVFNSFPIIWEMTRGGPGYETSTTTVFMYDLKGTFVGEAAAMSVVNFALVVVIVLVFLRLNRWNRRRSLTWPSAADHRAAAPAAPPAGRGRAPAAGCPSLRTAIIAAVAYLVAVVFLLPYLEMLITALRPQRELYDANYLPHHFAWSNFTDMWGAGFGINSRAGQPGGRRRRHPAGAAGGAARGVLHGPAPVPRPQRVPAAGAGHPDVPADRADRRHLQGVPRLRAVNSTRSGR